MCLRLETRNEVKLKKLKEKVKTTPVAHQLCRRVQLYDSFENIGVNSLNNLLEGAKIGKKIRFDSFELIWTTMGLRQSVTWTFGSTIRKTNLGSLTVEILKQILMAKGSKQFYVLMKTVVESFIAKIDDQESQR